MTKIQLKWNDDETTFNGKRYGWSSSDTPSVWTDSGWKPLVWASYHGLNLRKRRAMLRALILEHEEELTPSESQIILGTTGYGMGAPSGKEEKHAPVLAGQEAGDPVMVRFAYMDKKEIAELTQETKMNPFKTYAQVSFRSRVIDSLETPGELKEGTATDWIEEATPDLIQYFDEWLEINRQASAEAGDRPAYGHFSAIRSAIAAELAHS